MESIYLRASPSLTYLFRLHSNPHSPLFIVHFGADQTPVEPKQIPLLARFLFFDGKTLICTLDPLPIPFHACLWTLTLTASAGCSRVIYPGDKLEFSALSFYFSLENQFPAF